MRRCSSEPAPSRQLLSEVLRPDIPVGRSKARERHRPLTRITSAHPTPAENTNVIKGGHISDDLMESRGKIPTIQQRIAMGYY